VFIGEPVRDSATQGVTMYKPIEMVWKSIIDKSEPFYLNNPISMITGAPDSRFVDSAGAQKSVAKDDRVRMTLNDVFQLSSGVSIPELHVFFYTDIIDAIPGPRPLGERDIYGRIMPYFPYLDINSLPNSTSVATAITPTLEMQAKQIAATSQQIANLEHALKGITLPSLEGVKLLRWVWSDKPEAWEGAAVLFFGLKVTHERPFLRFFPSLGQPLTKVCVRGLLPIPDLPDPTMLLTWNQDKNPESGKESMYIKMQIQDSEGSEQEAPVYSTMFVYNDGTADLRIQPPKKVRLLDPVSDLQGTPEILERLLGDLPLSGKAPKLAEANAIFKLRMKRDASRITKAVLRSRLKAFTSLFQEIPPLPDEQPLVMLRFKGVSNFTNESRVFAFLTLLAEREVVDGEIDQSGWASKVAEEFQISLEEARKQVVAWMSQRGEFTLAVSGTKEYILNKNPGVDIAIFEQHPTYTFHVASGQDAGLYGVIIHLLGILMTADSSTFTKSGVASISKLVPAMTESPGPEEDDEGDFAFLNSDAEDGGPVSGNGGGGPVNGNGAAFLPSDDDDDIPEFMRAAMASSGGGGGGGPEEHQEQKESPAPEDKEAAKAFEKPADVSAIQLTKYYIERLKLADPSIFNYQRKDASERGYVSHCAANDGRQPIVLDTSEYDEMREVYKGDTDLEFMVYPDDVKKGKFQKKQPSSLENSAGILDGKPYPSEEIKEVITLVKYGSKAKRLHYYICPRLFCIRDRLLVRYKDYKSTMNRFTQKPKPENSCPFCGGKIITKEEMKQKKRDPTKTIIERKVRSGSDSERNIYIGFLDRRTPTGLALPCCFATTDNKFNPDDPEFIRLGLRGPGKAAAGGAPNAAVAAALAPAAADTVAGAPKPAAAAAAAAEPAKKPVDEDDEGEGGGPKGKSTAKYDYYRVIQGVSVKSIVDSSRIPLKIVEPKTADDPKAGPQIGFLPEALDKFFLQDSTSDKFAERLEIVSKLKPSAQGFLRLGVDNTNREQSLFSAVAPFFYLPNAEAVVERVFQPVDVRIPPRKFLQINGGNLVHEFYTKCDRKYNNDMRKFAATHLGISEIKDTNIPAIERLMCAYDNFKTYITDLENPQRKDLRVFYDIFSEPNIMPPRGILFIVLEVTVEEVTIKKGDKVEFKNEVKFKNVRCPPYPLNEGQQRADIGFLVHYNRIFRDRYTQAKTYKHMGWDPLFYVDGTAGIPDSRHRPTLTFQRSQEASWPPIVQRRVHEFFTTCMSINRGPFTSEVGIDPFALISAQEIMTAIRIQPNGIIRDAYNHLVGVGYKIPGQAGSSSGIAAVPVSDDGTFMYERNIYFDWDDFDAPPINKVIDFFLRNVVAVFPQYRGYVPKSQIKMAGLDKIVGLRLANGFVVPATDAQESSPISEKDYPIEKPIDHIDWDMNATIAYDSEARARAFRLAEEGRDKREGSSEDEIPDPKKDAHVVLKMESSQDDIEDIYQHLRFTFSTWLSTGAGSQRRKRLLEILKNRDLPLQDKRRRLDIMLYNDIIHWLEPKDSDEVSDIGFLRVDCQIQGEETCKGRCKWAPRETDDVNCGPCKIHTIKQIVDASTKEGTVINVPRMLYLRLVDELIRYAAKREEIFNRQVPRLTIRRKAQRSGDQYIIAEGTSDWNTWWEILRNEWIAPEKEGVRHFDEQFSPIPTGLPTEDLRSLPAILKAALDPSNSDPKIADLVWNPSTTPDRPFAFLKPVLRFHEITTKAEDTLTKEELEYIVNTGNCQVLYMPSGNISGSMRKKKVGALDAIIIASVDGNVGWVSKRGSYGVKVSLADLPDSLNLFRLL